MGVLGLWQLLSPVGQPVTLESLENKIFAVDISIWLNQALKGYRDSQGGSVPNAHLLSLFSRLCKLLFYKIRPIIVFDGGFPELKKQTIINRQQRRAAVKQSSRDFGLKILTNYLASKQLGNSTNVPNKVSFRTKSKPNEEIFKLPPLPECSQSILSDPCESNEDFESKFTNFSREDIKYLNQIDIESEDFNILPPDVKQEILSTLKESRRHRTWEQFEELPKESNEFSNYQMQCLLKKRKLQSKLEQVQKDLRQINSSAYVSQYTNDHVIGETNKIMSDDTSYYVLLKKIVDQKESKANSYTSEDVKPSTSSMADTKNAFIRDVENIDFDDDCFSDDSGSYKNVNKKKANLTAVNIKTEVNSLDLSDEEYNVDNPPLEDQVKDKHVEIFDQKTESETLRNINKNWTQEMHMSDKECIFDNSEKYSDVVKEDKIHQYMTPEKRKISDLENEIITSSEDEIELYDMNVITNSRSNINLKSKPSENNLTLETELPNKIDSIDTECPTTVKNKIDEKSIPSTSNNHLSEIASSVENKTNENNLMSTKSQSSDKIKHITEVECQSGVRNEIGEGTVSLTAEDHIPAIAVNDAYAQPSRSQSPDASLMDDESLRKANLELQEELNAATKILESEQAKQDRQSRSVQEHMIDDCKELLQLFGIPYIVSPLEAEAQCAFYDIIDFTHGTITDDSDVWLFGGKRVYKNFFTQQKFVECYKDKEIFAHFGLSRKKLINFALLTGSDYTEGIEGVGPVTAMEIISEFPGEGIDALQDFKNWWQDMKEHAKPPENKVRTKLQKLVLSQTFPEEKVFEAYLNPEVDSSKEKFTWGRPDLDALRDYTKERFGWNQSKVDGQLLPVLKKLNERDKQTHLDSFFTVSLRKETNLFPSKRIMSALKKITSPQKQVAEASVETSAVKRKPRNSGKKANPRKVVKKAPAVKSVGRKKDIIKSQGPVLSEESSSDS